jgi:ribonuclease-3
LAQSYVGGLYKDQGLAATKAWLDRLFTPYVFEAYRIVREQHGLPPAGVSNELQAVTGAGPMPPTPPPEFRIERMVTTTLGHLGLFNQRLQQQNKSIEWVFDDTVTESNRATPVWAARALIDGICWGYGRGNTKKSAKNEAAKQGLRRMGFDEASSSSICVPHAITHTQGTGLLACPFRPVPECASVPCAPSCSCVETPAL